MTDIIARSMAKGLRMTDQRRVIARVLGEAFDHPDVEELYARAARIDARISLATVYRTVKPRPFDRCHHRPSDRIRRSRD